MGGGDWINSGILFEDKGFTFTGLLVWNSPQISQSSDPPSGHSFLVLQIRASTTCFCKDCNSQNALSVILLSKNMELDLGAVHLVSCVVIPLPSPYTFTEGRKGLLGVKLSGKTWAFSGSTRLSL